jgi:hypothetical protein
MKKQMNRARYNALQEMEADLLSFKIGSIEESKKILSIVRAIERYKKYLRGE